MDQVESVLALSEIEDDALTGFRNLLERAAQLIPRVVNRRAKHVTGYILSMNAHQDRIAGPHVAHHHRQMHVTVDHVLERDCAELSIDSWQISFNGATNQNFLTDAIANQIGDRDYL